jgi:hypothetical protein
LKWLLEEGRRKEEDVEEEPEKGKGFTSANSVGSVVF